jgi:hypothetical protein
MTSSGNIDRIALALSRAGRDTIAYIDARNPDRPCALNVYRPHGYTPERPLVIVQHGVLRNGDDYRDFWIPAADKHKLLIVAPTFSNESWPGVESYNNGLVCDAASPSRQPRPVTDWAYALPGRIVADIRAAGISDCEQAYLFGHSAGGQFVHRLMSSQPHAPWRAVTIGNPGWYTLPTMQRAFPEGLGGVGLTEAHLLRLLAYPMTLLAGEQDIETQGEHLPSDPPAVAQGPHRYARARNYFESGRAEANRRGAPFNWTLRSVPRIGHDGRAMSAVCASLWFEGRMPDDAELAELAEPAGQRAA